MLVTYYSLLVFQEWGIGDEDAARDLALALTKSKRIRRLMLSGNGFLYKTMVLLGRSISGMTALQALDLSNNNLGLTGIMEVIKAFKVLSLPPAVCGLQSLNLRSTNLGNQGLKELALILPSLPQLRSLYLRGNSIYKEGAHYLSVALANLNSLRLLDIGNNRCVWHLCTFYRWVRFARPWLKVASSDHLDDGRLDGFS